MRKILLDRYISPARIFHESSYDELISLGIPKKAAEKLINSKNLDIVSKNQVFLKEKGIRIITRGDEDYPDNLNHIYDPPGVLYLRGQLPLADHRSIAIVGARDCTNYGREMAFYFAKELSKRGMHIISGLARGIDRYAHEGALPFAGSTYAVLGCGIDICYPRENINLYMDIIEKGGILSEYPPGYQPIQGNFPLRNRIISGMADGILLIEARKKSGSLITMEHGLDQGKNIYACPGRVFDSLSYGTNHIIQMGGKLVLEPNDILEDFQMEDTVTGKNLKKNDYMLEKEEKIVYDGLSLMPKQMEEILLDTGLTVEKASEVLFSLQLKGIIKQSAGNYFSRMISNETGE